MQVGRNCAGYMKKIVIFRNDLLFGSETFIKEQARFLVCWEPVLVGYDRVKSGLDLVIPLKTTVLISRIFRKLHAGRFCMRKSRFTDSQILAVLKQAENGVPVPELCREHGISSATFYKWRSKFGGMDASMMTRLKELEDENRRLKKMYAEERLKAEILKEAIEKKW